jgi:hypothetical protein
MKEFSINSYAYVQLTDIGIAELKKQHDRLNIKQHDKLNYGLDKWQGVAIE